MFKIDGADINMSLPIYDANLETRYEKDEYEEIASEKLAKILDKLSVSKATGTMALAFMKLGKVSGFGSQTSTSFHRDGLNMLDNLVFTKEFFSYLNNITKMGEAKVEIIKTKPNPAAPFGYIVVKNGNTHHKVMLATPENFPDLLGFLEQNKDFQATARLSTRAFGESLTKLSIPMYGVSNPKFNIAISSEKKTVGLLVKDSSNKISKDEIKTPAVTGSIEATLSMSAVAAAINGAEDDMDLKLHKNFTLIDSLDSGTILLNSDEG